MRVTNAFNKSNRTRDLNIDVPLDVSMDVSSSFAGQGVSIEVAEPATEIIEDRSHRPLNTTFVVDSTREMRHNTFNITSIPVQPPNQIVEQ